MVGKMTERKKEILIVEDDHELRELLAQAIRDISNDYEVKTAGNVDEAMVQVRRFQTLQKSFDLVITDIKMVGLTGLELLEVLHSISPQTKTIVMTAYSSADLAERAQELNVYAYLTKPFIISEFRQIVQSAFAPETAPSTASVEPPSVTQSPLSSGQLNAVRPQLTSLRMMTGAYAVVLLGSTGALLLDDAMETTENLANLGEALLFAQRHIEQQLFAFTHAGVQINQSYFGSDALNICLYRIDEGHFVGVLFGPAVREGQVWYYLRDAATGIKEALQKPAPVETEATTPSRRSLKDEYMAIVDQILAGDAPRRRRRDQSEPDRPKTLPSTPPGSTTSAISTPELVSHDQVETEPTDAAIVEEIDWDVNVNDDTGLSWDDIVAQAGSGFGGMTLEEAMRQGIDLTPVISTEQVESTTEQVEEALPSLDEINWDVEVQVDWDSLVSETDKGLEGLTLEEARKRGLIKDLDL